MGDSCVLAPSPEENPNKGMSNVLKAADFTCTAAANGRADTETIWVISIPAKLKIILVNAEEK